MIPWRALPRTFLPGVSSDGPIDIPEAELNKMRHVLRLSSGAEIAILPDDGTLIRCELKGRQAIPLETVHPETEPTCRVIVAQALPKGDKIDEIVKAGTGLGVAGFLLFGSERSVVQWDAKKRADRQRRLSAIAREEAEVCFRTRIPTITFVSGLAQVLSEHPDAIVLSEVEGLGSRFSCGPRDAVIVVGPEGGWSPAELQSIGDRGVSLGPRVLRVEYAAAAACALVLLSSGGSDSSASRAQ